MSDATFPIPKSLDGMPATERSKPPQTPEKAATPRPAPKAKPLPWLPRPKIPLWMGMVAAGFCAVAAYVYIPSLYVVETDDSYVQADTIAVVPKVAAYVTALHVTDNSRFSVGQLLVELDPRDFQVAVASAAATLQNAQAEQENAEAQLQEQAQVIAADQANIRGDHATLAFARAELARFGALAQDQAGTVERYQQAQSDIGQQQAAAQKDDATLAAAQTQIDVLESQVRQAQANVAHAQAGLAQAKLNLSYTKIYADVAGTVANRSVQVGDFVQPGQTLFAAVPSNVYIIANFKETQLTDMQVGQPVSIRADAFPGMLLHGHIDSFQRGTGSYFSLLPPENATGNFVKVVQRVPVKILIDGNDQSKILLAPGMSVEASVIIHTSPSWLPGFLRGD